MYWRALLAKHEWNIVHVSRESGMHRTGVYKQLQKLGIKLPDNAYRYTSAHGNRGNDSWRDLSP